MARALAEKPVTRTTLLEAAKKVLRRNGYSGLSTRDVAAAAGIPLSQIHYHFGSKQGMVLALFEYLNAQLLDRQQALFGDPTLKLSEQWDQACEYLDDDVDEYVDSCPRRRCGDAERQSARRRRLRAFRRTAARYFAQRRV